MVAKVRVVETKAGNDPLLSVSDDLELLRVKLKGMSEIMAQLVEQRAGATTSAGWSVMMWNLQDCTSEVGRLVEAVEQVRGKKAA